MFTNQYKFYDLKKNKHTFDENKNNQICLYIQQTVYKEFNDADSC